MQFGAAQRTLAHIGKIEQVGQHLPTSGLAGSRWSKGQSGSLHSLRGQMENDLVCADDSKRAMARAVTNG